jgi:hypothetical protein
VADVALIMLPLAALVYIMLSKSHSYILSGKEDKVENFNT